MALLSHDSHRRGFGFEATIRQMLEVVRSAFPLQVSYKSQQGLRLKDGTTVVPDFELQVVTQAAENLWTIECQDRQRSDLDVSHKIRAMKALSDRNRFRFVHADTQPVSDSLRTSLKGDGTIVESLSQFAAFLIALARDLDRSAEQGAAEGVEQRIRGVLAGWLPEPDTGSNPRVTQILDQAESTRPRSDRAMLSRSDPPPMPPFKIF